MLFKKNGKKCDNKNNTIELDLNNIVKAINEAKNLNKLIIFGCNCNRCNKEIYCNYCFQMKKMEIGKGRIKPICADCLFKHRKIFCISCGKTISLNGKNLQDAFYQHLRRKSHRINNRLFTPSYPSIEPELVNEL